MRNTMKVAKWEIKRNLKNKTFIIGMFLTPVLIIGFMLLGNTFGGSDTEETQELTTVFINDQLQLFSAIEDTVKTNDLPWELKQSDLSEEEVNKELEDTDDTAYLFIDQRSLEEGVIRAYTSEEIPPYFIN
ncbi:hypothetical protein PD280_08835 [Virgibacillus salarius]|nr:hypothetical protein [Virgibacillus salarius]WBX81760.1 hypothetical protein PD280_08835 [Virgibacillus salarius]